MRCEKTFKKIVVFRGKPLIDGIILRARFFLSLNRASIGSNATTATTLRFSGLRLRTNKIENCSVGVERKGGETTKRV